MKTIIFLMMLIFVIYLAVCSKKFRRAVSYTGRVLYRLMFPRYHNTLNIPFPIVIVAALAYWLLSDPQSNDSVQDTRAASCSNTGRTSGTSGGGRGIGAGANDWDALN